MPLSHGMAETFAGMTGEDFKVGSEHLDRRERVAMITDVEWIKQAARLFGFLISGPTKLFALSQAEAAPGGVVAPH